MAIGEVELQPQAALHKQPPHGPARRNMQPFHNVLAHAHRNATAATAGPHRHHSKAHHTRHSGPHRHARTLPSMSEEAEWALGRAIELEQVPQTWKAGLRFLILRESGGQSGATNPISSARGLFQLTRVNYHLNPRGAASFGNPVEEVQGGIRYVLERYQTVANAVAHWQRHRSY